MAERPNREKQMQKILSLALEGMLTDGSHHKQWYLYKILKAMNVPDYYIKEYTGLEGGDLGIAP